MKRNALIAVLSLTATLAPAYAFAQCSHNQQEAAMSCPQGQVYDKDARACVVTGA
jgi:hypothetical protein